MANCPTPVGLDKPVVWRDEAGWRCSQAVQCLKCGDVWTDDLTEETSWSEALSAASDAREVFK